MAEFSFHGSPELVEEIESLLPRDGTAWDQYVLESLRLRKRTSPAGRSRVVTNHENWKEIRDMLPAVVDEAVYIMECIELRKKIEGRQLVVSAPDTRTVEEKQNP